VTPPTCPTPEELAALAAGALSGELLIRVAAHIDRCPMCLAAIEQFRSGDPRVAALLQSAGNEHPPPDFAGRYTVIQLHATGGLGEVYTAEDLELGRRVALKRIVPARADDPDSRRRFLREAEITARLEHPGVVPVYGLVQDCDGRPYYAMRFVEGESLHDAVRAFHSADRAHRDPRERRLELRDLLTRFVTICQTVAYAHSRGVIHRDLKPANIMLGRYGEALVVDWGLAKTVGVPGADENGPTVDAPGGDRTRHGAVVGTPGYMSPEQAAGRHAEVGPASDIYSLGATLHTVLTGGPPGEPEADRASSPRRPSHFVPPALAAVCRKALSERPGDRYPTAADLGTEVERWLAGEPVAAHRERWTARAGRWARRHRTMVGSAAAALLVAAVIGGGAGVWVAREVADRRAERARLEEKDRDAIRRVLAALPRLTREWRFGEAVALLDQTAAGLSAFAPGEARKQLDRARGDVGLAQRLDEIRLTKSSRTNKRRDSAPAAAPEYRREFAGCGLDREDGDLETLRARLAASPIREALVAALDDWAFEEPDAERQARLIRAARAVDPSPWRERFWAASLGRDVTALRALAVRPEVDQQAPAVLTQLLWWVGVETPEGEQLVHRAWVRHPGDFWLNFGLAGLYYRRAERTGMDRESLTRAIGYYRACLALRPPAGSVLINLGAALYYRGDSAEAEVAYRRALELDSEDVLAHAGRGYALLRLGDWAGAEAAFRSEIKFAPNDPDAHGDLGRCLRGRGDLKGAIRAYRKRIDLAPRSAVAHSDLGDLLQQAGDLPGAEAACHEALECDPTFAHAHNNLGMIKWRQEKRPEAMVAYLRALELDPKLVLAHNNMGAAWRSRGEGTWAVTCFRRALELDPTLAPAHYNLGNALSDQGDLIGALAAYRAALARDPKLVPAYLALSQTLRDLGRFAEARAIALRVIDLFPPRTPGHNAVLGVIRRCDLMIRLDRQLPAVLSGTVHLAGPAEHLAFAELVARRRWYAASARLYEELLRKYPPLKGRPDVWSYNAACSAALAGCGQGTDHPTPTGAERTCWRGQALNWLRAGLTWHAALLAGPDTERQARQTLSRWRTDPNLAGVREAAELAKLPDDEQKAWERFWGDVDYLLVRTQQ
jgi:serine/threonine-protein kinase